MELSEGGDGFMVLDLALPFLQAPSPLDPLQPDDDKFAASDRLDLGVVQFRSAGDPDGGQHGVIFRDAEAHEVPRELPGSLVPREPAAGIAHETDFDFHEGRGRRVKEP